MQNFIGEDNKQGRAVGNKNAFRKDNKISGIHFTSEGVDKNMDQWGEMGLVTLSKSEVSYRTAWIPEHWGSSLLDFWDDLSLDGILENRKDVVSNKPMASLAARDVLAPNENKTVRFLITWYFPNRTAWSSKPLKNYYCTKYNGAWDVALKTAPRLDMLEDKTIQFTNAFINSDLPKEVIEAALFNISTLRTQTCFRLTDGNFYAWEGCNDNSRSCFGYCTHV